jgi:hypothetical protein
MNQMAMLECAENEPVVAGRAHMIGGTHMSECRHCREINVADKSKKIM